MAADPMPTADVVIDEALVRALLEEQHPDLAALPLAEPVFGWDNVMLRLGTDLIVRLPRRVASAELIEHEQRWLPELAPLLPLAVPAPRRIGRPGAGFSWSWSVCPWLPGEQAATHVPDDMDDAARSLGAFFRALHRSAPAEAPDNPFRGVPLPEREEATRARVEQLGDEIDRTRVLATWEDLAATPPWTEPAVWLHGDMHPSNVLVHGGQISAVIDFGDITSGDPATDLAIAWMLLPATARDVLRESTGGHDEDTWRRARGWALTLAVAILSSSADNHVMAGIGRRTLDAALREA